MTAGKYDFEIEQGTTFSRVFRWRLLDGTPVDLTGTTARMQIWDKPHRHMLVDVKVEGTVAVDGPAGTVTIGLPDSVTSELDFDTAQYDLKLDSAAHIKTRLIQGFVTLSPQETV